MKPARRSRVLALFVLAVLAGSPGVLVAGCALACPFGKLAAGRSCCRLHGAAPAVGAVSCCAALRATAPAETSRAVAPSSSAAFSPAPPVELSGAPAAAEPVPELPPKPPPLYQGIGLYTLHAAFLI